jgi:hypothetical protein
VHHCRNVSVASVERTETRTAGFQAGHGSGFNNNMNQMQNLDPVVPLQATENRWDGKAIQVDQDSPELVERKVKGLLNKLTMEKFASISDQIIAWANKSEMPEEKDGRTTLIQVIRLVFEKATDEATWSEMYARLCRKMMEQISTNVQDDGIKNSEGKPITGGQLFRKYLKVGQASLSFECRGSPTFAPGLCWSCLAEFICLTEFTCLPMYLNVVFTWSSICLCIFTTYLNLFTSWPLTSL